ncbi:hypothetical protein OsI_10677 [Oryza sativa Indica Group]|uniref:Uncharacterized protein n=1 Tax=Oryza sativa subsp. indica TaxID=39946 RepID=B8AK22_ORYSI|nr:hypothetical protein OsI_10677 [Oryza sativa Indica Group]
MGRVGPLDRWPDPQNSAPEGLWVDPYNFRVKRVQEPVHPGSTRNRLTTALRRGDALLSWIEAAAAASGWGDAPPAGSRARGGSGGGGNGDDDFRLGRRVPAGAAAAASGSGRRSPGLRPGWIETVHCYVVWSRNLTGRPVPPERGGPMFVSGFNWCPKANGSEGIGNGPTCPAPFAG